MFILLECARLIFIDKQAESPRNTYALKIGRSDELAFEGLWKSVTVSLRATANALAVVARQFGKILVLSGRLAFAIIYLGFLHVVDLRLLVQIAGLRVGNSHVRDVVIDRGVDHELHRSDHPVGFSPVLDDERIGNVRIEHHRVWRDQQHTANHTLKKNIILF